MNSELEMNQFNGLSLTDCANDAYLACLSILSLSLCQKENSAELRISFNNRQDLTIS